MRISKDIYYLNIADTVSDRSTCLRRKYGSVIVKDDRIVSTGYNGAPRGEDNCNDLGYCEREELKVPQGQRYELCCAVHSEVNAIISASSQEMKGATLYLSGRDAKTGDIIQASPCRMCRRVIKNSGITTVVCRSDNPENRVTIIPVKDL